MANHLDVEPLRTLRTFMNERGWKASKLATELGIDRSAMSSVFSGKKRLPLQAIRNAVRLGMPANTMLIPFPCEKAERAKWESEQE